MSMFNWGATNGEPVVSNHIWLYFCVAIVLTLVVLGIWILWYRWTQRKESERAIRAIEIAMNRESK